MGTTLTGTAVKDTYDGLIKVTDNGPLSGSLKTLTDGLGNDSALALSTGAASVTGNLTATGAGSAYTGGALEIQGSANAIKTFYINRYGVASGSQHRLRAQNAYFEIASANSEPIVLTGGNVGIGTAIPTKKLQVAGAVGVQSATSVLSSSDTGLYLATGGNTSNYNGLFFQGVSSKDMYIGRVGQAGVDDLIVATAEASPVEIVRFRRDGGITFNGDTAAANALDDYEEGTFSPTVEGSSSAGTATYVVASGRYTKIGNQVSVSIDLSWNSGTGTGSLKIANLPFANVSNNNAASIGFIDQIALTALNIANAYVAPSSSRIDFVQTPTGGGSVTDVTYDAAGRIIVAAVYYVS